MFHKRFFLIAVGISSLALAGCVMTREQTARAAVDRLVSELVEICANTYIFCIHSAATDWDDLKLFW